LVLIAMTLFALSYLYGKEASQRLGSLQTNAFTCLLSGLILFPLAVSLSPADTFSLMNPGWKHLLFVLISFQIVGLSLWYYTLELMEGWMISALRTLGPVLAAPIAWIYFDETLSLLQLISCLVVIGTSALIAREHIAGR